MTSLLRGLRTLAVQEDALRRYADRLSLRNNRPNDPSDRNGGDLRTPLFWLSPRAPSALADACEGTGIIGVTGGGKSSGSGQTVALAYLRAGFGGLVLTAKTHE